MTPTRERKSRVLFVDDDRNVLESLRRMLHARRGVWDMHFCQCPRDALATLLASPFDTVVSDLRMPGLTGLELLQRLQETAQTRDVPVIIVTGEADRSLKRKALDLGASDLLNKPVEGDDLVARIRSSLRLKAAQDDLRAYSRELEGRVIRRTAELADSRLDIVWRLGKAAEFRDEQTGDHVVRVGCYSRAVAGALGLGREFTETIFLAAPLHDIGKIGIPDAVLRKRGALSPEEWRVMRTHCAIGASIVSADSKLAGAFRAWAGARPEPAAGANPLLTMASAISLAHHEKWDGSGYPRGLRRDDIPLEGRVVAIADVYDALRSKRPYKPALSWQAALAILQDGVGRHFDPEVYRAFRAAEDEIRAIEVMFADQAATGEEGEAGRAPWAAR
jgi:putative two-component system response regulator